MQAFPASRQLVESLDRKECSMLSPFQCLRWGSHTTWNPTFRSFTSALLGLCMASIVRQVRFAVGSCPVKQISDELLDRIVYPALHRQRASLTILPHCTSFSGFKITGFSAGSFTPNFPPKPICLNALQFQCSPFNEASPEGPLRGAREVCREVCRVYLYL